uniref:Uncharacterized protein n=1 Tax=Meloidogyne enterolobii TaxID=390850 RepID=A0A6V7VRI2_MELEN|nr:unnamed protein product [Meloidogyne enterolobii]
MNNNLGNNNGGCYGIGEIEEEKEFLQHPKPPVKLPRRSKEHVMPVIFIDEKMLAEQNRRSKIYLANQMLS